MTFGETNETEGEDMTYNEIVTLIRERGGFTAARTELRRILADKEGTGVTTEIAGLSQGELIARLTDGDGGEPKAEAPAPTAVEEELPWETPEMAGATKPAPKPTAEAPSSSVKAALDTLAAALAAPKAAPVDERRIIANAVDEAVKAAHEVAQTEAHDFMKKSVAEFIRDGSIPSPEHEEVEAKPKKAVMSGVEATAKAMSWTAKASDKAKEAVDKLTKFLSEFSFFRNGVSMRLVNTFARGKTDADKKATLRSYCEVSQMEDLQELVEKMKSPEFVTVCSAFSEFKPGPVNKRFAVFYGAPGGGKTYAAVKAGEAINGGAVEVVPCSPSMDAADMLYAYRLDYKTGKRGYVPTALLTAMTAGRAVVLDEINLLPMEARMFLQNLLKTEASHSVSLTLIQKIIT